MTDEPDTLADARKWVDRLRASLPQSVDIASLGVKDKAPWMLLATREALIWRTEEIARNACHALESNDLSVAAILTRAVTENAALTWSLMDLLKARDRHTRQALHELLSRYQLGSRAWPEMPEAIQILNCIDKMDKVIPGVRSSYNGLSDIVHPNWRGVAGMYSVNDQATYITHFGRGLRGTESTHGSILSALLGSLGTFEYAYNRIADLMPTYLAELESLWPDPDKGISDR